MCNQTEMCNQTPIDILVYSSDYDLTVHNSPIYIIYSIMGIMEWNV